MFDQRLEKKEFCRNDYHQSLERNSHLTALSANIMLIFALVEAFFISLLFIYLFLFSCLSAPHKDLDEMMRNLVVQVKRINY